VTEQANTVLAKVAQVLNGQPNIEFMVEGHTDNVPIKSSCIKDNWDLSVLRQLPLRILQKIQYRSEAHHSRWRSEYVDIASNDTPDGKAANRRTRIVIQPQLISSSNCWRKSNKLPQTILEYITST
jgi:chemotaxis protein MotB